MNYPRRFRCSRLRIVQFFKIVILDDLTYESFTVFLPGFSQAQRWIHGITQIMIHDEILFFIKNRFVLDCSPVFKNVPWACRDFPRPLPDSKNHENLEQTENSKTNRGKPPELLSAIVGLINRSTVYGDSI